MFELRVLTGLHKGAALPLVGEQWTVGAEETRDLALHDPGIESLHCRLQRVGEGWQLLAEEGRVFDEEGHAHGAIEVQPHCPFVLGCVWVCLAPAESPWATLPALPGGTRDTPERGSPAEVGERSRARLLNRTAGIAFGVLLGVMGSAWSLSWPTSGEAPVAPAASTGSPVIEHAEASDGRTRLGVDEAARVLKMMLSDRLLTAVQVEPSAQGLVLTGSLQGEGMLVYERMLQRFETDYATDFTLHDQVSNGAAGLPFVIVQVIAGPHGHLVMEDGRRLYVGDKMDGLRLQRIDNERILFDGARRHEVAW